MPRFSERIGVKPPKTVLQLNSMDDDLRNGLWNVAQLTLWRKIGWRDAQEKRNSDVFFTNLWQFHYKEPVDTIPVDFLDRMAELRKRYFGADWYAVYDFIENTAMLFPQSTEIFINECNVVMETERSGYRFVGKQLTTITNEQELASVQAALSLPDRFKPTRQHLDAAVALFSNRQSPDYRNSVKESISAVEAICTIITGDNKATLGQGLKRLEDKGVPLHNALKTSFSSLYGYTSDADGIRHALLVESTIDFDDAKFMLVSCSAFVNYLAAKANKAGVIAEGR